MVGGPGEKRGLIPRTMEYIFTQIQKKSKFRNYAVYVSFLEIYLDQVRDLGRHHLAETGATNRGKTSRNNPNNPTEDYATENLEIHEGADGKVFIKDLSSIRVESVDESIAVITSGFAKRATFETAMNPVSSRSHTVFSITIASSAKTKGESMTGTLHLVDLAGSERLNKSQSTGPRLEEAKMISKSLSALANCIVALAEGAAHVPYRDSKLTRILQNALGGNSFTTLLATLLPNNEHFEECLATLQFATRCRYITNAPHINYLDFNPEAQERRIKKLLAEVADLKSRLDAAYKTIDDLRAGGAGDGAGGTRSRDIGSRGSANGDIEKQNEYMQRVVENVSNEKRMLQKKLEKKKEDFRSVQEKVSTMQETHFSQVSDLRNKILGLTNNIEGSKQLMISQLNMITKQHEDEINQLTLRNQKLMEEQAAFVDNLSKERAKDRQAQKASDEKFIQLKLDYEAQLKEQLRERQEHYNEELAQSKAYYEQLLNARKTDNRDEREKYQKVINQLRSEKEALAKELTKTQGDLAQLRVVMQDVERGVYPIKERGNVRSVHIPSAQAPRDLVPVKDTTTPANLHSGVYNTVSGRSSTSLSGEINNAPQPTKRDSSRGTSAPSRLPRQPAHQQQGDADQALASVAERNEFVSGVSEAYNYPSDRPGSDTPGAERRHQYERLTRKELIDIIISQDPGPFTNSGPVSLNPNRTLEAQLLADLSQNDTVQYILQIEKEKKMYYDRFHDEKKKTNQMNSVIQSLRRQLEHVTQARAASFTPQQQMYSNPPSSRQTARSATTARSTSRSTLPPASPYGASHAAAGTGVNPTYREFENEFGANHGFDSTAQRIKQGALRPATADGYQY